MATEDVESEVTGTVWKIECKVGDTVADGDILMILESMKMEIPVEAPSDLSRLSRTPFCADKVPRHFENPHTCLDNDVDTSIDTVDYSDFLRENPFFEDRP